MQTIVFLHDGDVFAGSERSLLQLATSLDARRYNIVIVETCKPVIARHFGYRHPHLTFRLATHLNQGNPLPLWRFLRTLSADHVHFSQCWLDSFTWKKILAARLAVRGRVTMSQHTHWRALRQPARRRKFNFGVGLWQARYIAAARLCDDVIAVSESLKRSLHTDYGYPIDRLRVQHFLPDPVDWAPLPVAHRRIRPALGTDENTIAFIIIGRLYETKRVNWVVEAFARVVLASSRDAVLWIVGDGPERGALERLVKARRVADRVHFFGWREDVRVILSDADVLVHASEFEGFCGAIVQASLCARPCIATRCAGVEEPLAGGESCVEPSIEAITDSMLGYADLSREQIAQIGEVNRQKFLARFDYEAERRKFPALLGLEPPELQDREQHS